MPAGPPRPGTPPMWGWAPARRQRKSAATRRHRPGRVTVARIAFASSSKPQLPATPAADCVGPIAIVLPLTPSTGLTLYHHALAAPRQAHHPAGGEVLG